MTGLQIGASIAAIVCAVIALVSIFISLHTKSRVKRFEIEIREIRSSVIQQFINPEEVTIYQIFKGEVKKDETEDEGKNKE